MICWRCASSSPTRRLAASIWLARSTHWRVRRRLENRKYSAVLPLELRLARLERAVGSAHLGLDARELVARLVAALALLHEALLELQADRTLGHGAAPGRRLGRGRRGRLRRRLRRRAVHRLARYRRTLGLVAPGPREALRQHRRAGEQKRRRERTKTHRRLSGRADALPLGRRSVMQPLRFWARAIGGAARGLCDCRARGSIGSNCGAGSRLSRSPRPLLRTIADARSSPPWWGGVRGGGNHDAGVGVAGAARATVRGSLLCPPQGGGIGYASG